MILNLLQLQLHGLRHENLNPLLGCLMEPSRPALVWEWCSRGSLEDVLIQDEIKLDWSFRLSLLTDLVRVSCTMKLCFDVVDYNIILILYFVLLLFMFKKVNIW